jgi:hypothetical protein
VSRYGGVDDLARRKGCDPAGFKPQEKPFYAALPYCDMEDGGLKTEAAKVVPWFIASFRGQGKACVKDAGLKFVAGCNLVTDSGRMWDRSVRIRRPMCSAANVRPRTPTTEPEWMFHRPSVIVSGCGRWTWLTGDLWIKLKSRTALGPCTTAREKLKRWQLVIGKTYLERGKPVIVLTRWGKGGGPATSLEDAKKERTHRGEN